MPDVIPFEAAARASLARAHGRWRPDEAAALARLEALLRRRTGAGEAALGATEEGDPQLYLLLPGPDAWGDDEDRCVACVTRLGRGASRLYLLEDGEGRVLAEAGSLDALADRAASGEGRRGASWRRRPAVLAGACLGALATLAGRLMSDDTATGVAAVLAA